MESTHTESEVRFTGITTFNDLLTWNIRLGIEQWIKMAIASLCIILISVVGYALRFPRYFSLSFSGFMFVFVAALLLFVGLIMLTRIYWGTKRSFKSGKALRLQTTYTVSKDGIRIETVQSNSLIKWDQLLSVVEIKPMFILYVSLRQAFIVPKRYFNSHEDIISFKKIIMSEMDAKKLKLRRKADITSSN